MKTLKTTLSSALLAASLTWLGACGGDPDTSKNPVCVGNSCEGGLVCCEGLCIPPEAVCKAPDLDATSNDVTTDTSGPSDTEQPDSTVASDTSDTSVSDSAATDSTGPTDTSADTDTSPGGLVLVDPGMHTLGGAVSAGGIMLLDASLDGVERKCVGNLCVIGGITP